MKALFAFLLFTGLAIMSNATSATNASPTSLKGRIAEFRQALDFDAVVAKENKQEFVDLAWEHLPTPPQLAGWRTTKQELSRALPPNGEMVFMMALERDDEFVTITSTIFSSTEQAAAEFLDFANSSTMMEIPYVRGPKSLGTLSAMDKNRISAVFWFYKNIFTVVEKGNTTISHFDVAAWLHEQMERHTKLRQQ